MDQRTTGVVSYITPIGWLAAYFAGSKEESKFQLNQTLGLWLAFIILGVVRFAAVSILGFIPLFGVVAGILVTIVYWLIFLALAVCWVIGLIGAVNGEDKPMPIFGGISLLK